uniref:Reverse transcriptase domain-containing protein n=1 Tax=Tanacetum cinerariifolium TaxID=118510 RepID=A0A6L2JU35_TANCI|nr:reverse transcriptase domain-containing protein [Tanacetum cinerariifolium]
MQEVVKKEIVKLLDTSIIYPITDSPWLSPIHCVPKKGGIIVVTNENDELVPTRTVTGWREKCHFMVKEGIVLGHKVSSAGLEVDKAKIDVISKLPPPTNIKGIISFLEHAGFYRRFIKDFSKIARPLTKVLEKDTTFEFNDECQKEFELLKDKHTCAPVIVSPNWNLPFELMCDASDFAVGAILGQKYGKNFYPIYFASKTLNPSQQKYTVTEKELMAVVFAFDKFRSYLILSKTIFHTDHSALRHLFKKQDAKPCFIRCILLLQEFDIEIKDRKGTENIAADHLSRIENDESSDDNEVDDNFPGETLMEINIKDEPWLADFANNLVGDVIPKGMTRFISGLETRTILDQCHHGPIGRHYGPNVTAKTVLDLGFYWLTIIKEAHNLVRLCEASQKTGNISKHNEMPLNNIQKRRNRRRSKQIVEPELRTTVETPIATMADTLTMSELLQAHTEGYRDAIRFDETFSEAWDPFKDLHRKYPHHSFSEWHQIDTFYNALTQTDQDSLNVAAGGNILNRTPRDALTIIENKSKVCTSRNNLVVSKVSATTSSSTPAYLPEITALTDAVKAMLL